MTKKVSILKLTSYVIAVMPLIVVAMTYESLPNEIVMNWGIDGAVDYSSKAELWILAGMSPLFAIFFTFLPKIDPRKKNYEKFKGSYDLFVFGMMLFLLGMISIVIYEGLYPNTLNIMLIVMMFCGGLFTILGNIMPKVRSNFFMGIRTPWSLSSDTVWNKTQRLGGRMMFGGGLVIFTLPFLGFSEMATMILLFLVLMIVMLPPTIMSYVWYKEENAETD